MTKKPEIRYIPFNARFPREDYQIFTTGAACEPLRFRHHDGSISWHWVVTEFVDDSFWRGLWVNPLEEAEYSENLIEFPEEPIDFFKKE